jgi:hypothetical protein
MSWPWIALFGLQWVVVVGLLVVVLGLNQRVLALWSGRGSGAIVPTLPSTLPLAGQALPSSSPLLDVGSGNRIFLFVGSGCPPCRELGLNLAVEPAETLRVLSDASLLMVTDAAGESLFAIPGVSTFVLDDGISDAVGVQSTPTAIAVDPEGVVRAAGFANTLTDVGRFADRLSAIAAAV